MVVELARTRPPGRRAPNIDETCVESIVYNKLCVQGEPVW